MLTVAPIRLSQNLLLAGQTVTATVSVTTDVPDTPVVTLQVFGSQITVGQSSPGGAQASGNGSGPSPATLVWTPALQPGQPFVAKVTFQAGPETFSWQGAIVAEAQSAAAGPTGTAVGFNVGPASLEAVGLPVPTYAYDGPIPLLQLTAPYRVEPGQPIECNAAWSAPWNGDLIGAEAKQGYFGSLTLTGGPSLTLISASGFQKANTGTTDVADVPLSGSWSASATGLITVTALYWQGGALSTVPGVVVPQIQLSQVVGVGVNPPVQQLPPPGGGGSGVHSLLGSGWPWLVEAGMLTAAHVTDQVLSHGRQRTNPVTRVRHR